MKQIFSGVGYLDLSTVVKRKVRKDFDLTKSYSVDVSKCSKEEKKEVQQAFFDAGFQWLTTGKTYNNLDDVQYSNTTDQGTVTRHLLYGTNTDDCNMTAEEFLDFVYEPENQGHVHADSMAKYAEDAKVHTEPWKLWESKSRYGTWHECLVNPRWVDIKEYRRKTKTHTVNGVEIPDLRITPELEQYYWYPDPNGAALVQRTTRKRWSSSINHRIKHGLCYKHSEDGKQAAILHAKAWLGLDQQ